MHLLRRDASRADCTAGKSSATSTPMIAITTSNSTSVKPRRRRPAVDITSSFDKFPAREKSAAGILPPPFYQDRCAARCQAITFVFLRKPGSALLLSRLYLHAATLWELRYRDQSPAATGASIHSLRLATAELGP